MSRYPFFTRWNCPPPAEVYRTLEDAEGCAGGLVYTWMPKFWKSHAQGVKKVFVWSCPCASDFVVRESGPLNNFHPKFVKWCMTGESVQKNPS